METVDVEEALKYLDWLGDERLTFWAMWSMAVRPTAALLEATSWRQCLTAGLACCDQSSRRPPSSSARPQPNQPTLRLTLTKSSQRSTVHRPLYLDDIAVGIFDARGRPIGEHQFLGLFNSAAYHERVRIPMLRRKVAALLERMAFSSTSHSGRDVIEILEDYPRDELVQVSLDELELPSTRFHQERQRLRLFPRHDHRAATSPRSSTCRGTATPAGRLRLEQILRDAFDADRSSTPPWSRLRFWPTTSSSAVPMRHHFPRPTTTSWSDGLRTRSVPGATVWLTR